MKQEKENLKEETEHQIYYLETDDDLRSVLQKLPSLIKQNQDLVFRNQIQKGESIKKTKTIVADTQRAIATETHETEDKKTGELVLKKRYTNDMQRESQLNVRLMNHKEYNRKRDATDRLDKNISETEIELSYLKRLNSNAGYLVLLGTKK